MGFAINSLEHPCAAEVVGLDCGQPLAEDVFQTVNQAYHDHPVLVFRNQTLSAPQLAAFGRQFGALETYGVPSTAAGKKAANSQTAALRETNVRETPDQFLYQSPDDPDVLIMTNEVRDEFAKVGIVDNAEAWHSDGSHKPEPYSAIIVHVVRNPSSGGGDTEFCDLRMVYNALPPNLRVTLNGRSALHHWSKSLNPRFSGVLDDASRVEGERIAEMIPPIRQPLVRTHPETGRPHLYLSPRFTLSIEDMPQEISDMFLNELFAFMDDPVFRYRHEWREQDLMIWDNRCLNHRVRAYDAHDIRTRHRVTVSGYRPYYRGSDAPVG